MTPSDPTPPAPRLSRRDLLKVAAAAGAGLALAPTLLAAEAEPAEKELGLAVIGCGTQGLILMDQLMKIGGVRVRAVCDLWPYSRNYAAERLKAYRLTAGVYGDYAEMLDQEKKGLDAVLIATPDGCHAEQAIACFKAGLHVYCEEPLAPTLKEARDMILAARQAKRVLQAGYQRRSHPRYLAALDYVTKKKACGNVLAVSAQWNRTISTGRGWPKDHPMDEAVLKKHGYDTMDRFRDWLWHKKFSAGPMSRFGATQLDVLNVLLGAVPRAVTAAATRRATTAAEWPDTYYAIYEWELDVGGKKRTVLGKYQIQQGTSHRGYFEEVVGDEGVLRLSEARPPGRLIREYGAPFPDWEKALKRTEKIADSEMMETFSVDPDEDEFYVQPPSWQLPETRDYTVPVKEQPHFQPHLENFFEALRKGTPPACPGEAAYAALASALAAHQAAETHKRVELAAEDFKV
jgi:predicted dehydrogenase